MKRNITCLALAGAMTTLLVACATPPAERKGGPEADAVYMGAVENAAGRVGTRVIWVNPPKRERQARDNDS